MPALPGRTAGPGRHVGVDDLGAVLGALDVTPVKAAALFGVTLAARGEQVDLHGFADGVFRHPVGRGASVLKEIERFCARVGEVGHGTQIADSLRRDVTRARPGGHHLGHADHRGGHARRRVTAAVPAHVPMYGFNLGGYQRAGDRRPARRTATSSAA